jgi:hypothetical protein
MLYRLAFGFEGSTKMNGSSEAVPDSANGLSPEFPCTTSCIVFTSPETTFAASVPEKEDAVLPQFPLLQTGIEKVPNAL